MSYPIPITALDDRLAIVGTAGAGKTYVAMGAMEKLFRTQARVIAIDPLGVMWGLRLMPGGKRASPYRPVIFGGGHGDLPISEHHGAIIGETVATMRESCIVDLSTIGTKAGERRFMLAFLTALYRHTDKQPVHLIIDEADMFAPQKLLDKDGDAAKLLGMMETVVRRGRARGFIPWLVTQRPAVLSKDVLSQADGIVAMKLTAKQDRNAIKGWVETSADAERWKAIDSALPTKQRGEAVLWVPGRGILEDVQFPPKTTYDSSRTPKRGEKRSTAHVKPLDLGKLKDRLAAVEADAKASDPKLLKAEIARLKIEVARKTTIAPVAKAWSQVELDAMWLAGERTGFMRGVKAYQTETAAALKNAAAVAYVPGVPPKTSAKRFTVVTSARQSGKSYAADVAAGIQLQSKLRTSGTDEWRPKNTVPRTTNAITENGAKLSVGETTILVAAAQFNGVERDQLSILTGYKRSTRDAYVQRLREKGYVDVSGQFVNATPDGMAALPSDYEPLPTGEALQAYWLKKLRGGEAKIFQVLLDAYPDPMPRTDLDEAVGFKRSTRDAYIQRLKLRKIVNTDGGMVHASSGLFA